MPKVGEISGRLVNGELELVFAWSGDRYTQTIVGGGSQLESAEAAGFETPVFQEVHQQGEILFLSGMSAGRHWSASVEPAGKGFAFDVACRVKETKQPAASCYTGSGYQVEPIAEDDEAPAIESAGDRLLIKPINTTSELPHTIRYRYQIA